MKKEDKKEALQALGQHGSELVRLSNEKRETEQEIDKALEMADNIVSDIKEELPVS